MANVYMVVNCPDEKLKPLLSHIKQFDEDDKDDVSMIEVIVHAPELGADNVEAIFKELGMPYFGEVRWAEKAAQMEWKSNNG